MRELKLRYFLELVSNIATKSRSEAQVLQEAHRKIDKAVSDSAGKVLGLDKGLSKVGSNRGAERQAEMQRRLHGRIATTTQGLSGLDRAITRAGNNTSTERQIGYMQRLGNAIQSATQRHGRLRQALASGLERGPELAAAAVGGYYGARTMLAPPLRAFSGLESATEDLRISMLDAGGKVAKDFDKISVEAVKLGNQLPGTTKDFMMAARALQTQGVPSSVVANGGLRASSYVGALLDVNQSQSAEIIAKLREAHGLKDDELVPMADLVQRGFFGFGIKPQDYLETAKYAAPVFNTMGITGIEKTRQTLAIQGMAANVGLEASSFGTNYAMMLSRLAQIEARTNRNSKEAKEAKALLGEHGIQMQFYDDKGVFKGNENMLQELSKLRGLNPLEQNKVITRLFGQEAGRPAQIMVQKGLEGYKAALATIDNQADLDARMAMKMETFAAKLEGLTGTIENAMARIAAQTGQGLKPVMDGANRFIGGPVSDFFDRHPGAGTAAMGAGGLGGLWLGSRVFGRMGKLLGLGGGAPAAAKVVEDKAFTAMAKQVADEAAKVAGGSGSAAAAGGAAAAGAGAPGARTAALGARGWLQRLGVAGAALGIGMDLFGTSDEEIAVLKEGERQRNGYRGQNFVDPRRLDLPQALSVSAPSMPATPVNMGGVTEVKVGEGSLAITLHLDDQRTWMTPTVVQQPSLIKLNPGSTDPAGLR